MINSNELRPGVLVYAPNVNDKLVPIKVESLNEEGIELIEEDFSRVPVRPAFKFIDLQPIPLTDKILDSAFKSKGNYFVEDECIYLQKQSEGAYRLVVEPSDDYYLTRVGTPIKSVHQLQNLYFVLTGKELEINL